jgi:hypothetical protein
MTRLVGQHPSGWRFVVVGGSTEPGLLGAVGGQQGSWA